MKQEFSPEEGNSLHETCLHDATESVLPEHVGQGEAMDLPFVVVKLEDESNSSDTESEELEWMRPVEFAEDYEDSVQEPSSGTATSISKKHHLLSELSHMNDEIPKHEYSGEKGKEKHGDAGVPKKKTSKRKNKNSRPTSPSRRQKTKGPVERKIRSKTVFSKRQEALMQTFMESHATELFGPKKKSAHERQSLWEDLTFRVNAQVTQNRRKTQSAIQKWAVALNKAGILPTRERKTSLRSSRKYQKNSLDAEESDRSRVKDEDSPSTHKRLFQMNTRRHTAAQSQERETQALGSSASGVSAPYSRFQPAHAISPQQATEPPPFPSLEYNGKGQCCERLEGVLFEVLNFCKFMCTTIQRLEEKIDRLQSNSSNMQQSHLNFPIPEEVSWHSGVHGVPRANGLPLSSSRFGPNHWSFLNSPSLGPVAEDKTPPAPTPVAHRGRPGLPRASYTVQTARLANSQLKSRQTKGGGKRRRGRGRGRAAQPTGRAAQPTMAPANQTQVIGAPPSGAGAMDDLSVKVPPMGPSATESVEDEQLVLIGSSLRKVRISASEYLKAFRESEPLGAVAVILRAVFPDSVLAHSGVTGNQAAGVQQLDPNKIEAIREWLAEMFPKHDLDVRGVDWAACLGVISSVVKGLRSPEGQGTSFGRHTSLCHSQSNILYFAIEKGHRSEV